LGKLHDFKEDFNWESNLGSKKAGLSSDFWENCMILKKILIGKSPFFGVCYISRKIT
jgi:hypothetical protein